MLHAVQQQLHIGSLRQAVLGNPHPCPGRGVVEARRPSLPRRARTALTPSGPRAYKYKDTAATWSTTSEGRPRGGGGRGSHRPRTPPQRGRDSIVAGCHRRRRARQSESGLPRGAG
eukprot:scaffold53_cov362-Prasinococcus_capsulatus_cf.AAC.9